MSTFASTVTHLDLDLVIDLADWMESELYQVKGVKIGMLSRRGGLPSFIAVMADAFKGLKDDILTM